MEEPGFRIRKSKTLLCFRNKLRKTAIPKANSVYNSINPTGLKYLTKLRLGLNHLSEQRLKHNFSDCINLLCSCVLVYHFFLHSHYFLVIWTTCFNDLSLVDPETLKLNDNEKVELLLHRCSRFNKDQIYSILNAVIAYTLKSKWFLGPLL